MPVTLYCAVPCISPRCVPKVPGTLCCVFVHPKPKSITRVPGTTYCVLPHADHRLLVYHVLYAMLYSLVRHGRGPGMPDSMYCVVLYAAHVTNVSLWCCIVCVVFSAVLFCDISKVSGIMCCVVLEVVPSMSLRCLALCSVLSPRVGAWMYHWLPGAVRCVFACASRGGFLWVAGTMFCVMVLAATLGSQALCVVLCLMLASSASLAPEFPFIFQCLREYN